LGWGDWLVVDSCVATANPPTPYAPLYLDRIGVPFEDVRWPLASHWHDDHTAGFSAQVRLCSGAEILISEALASEEFIALAMLEVDEPPAVITSGRHEMRGVMDELRASGRAVQQARADVRLFLDDSHGVTREIWALSPSTAASVRSKQAFASEFLLMATARKRLPAPQPNETSVVLLIRVGDVVALLGADLENHPAPDRGWKALLASAGRPRDRASLYKVAHHGADNGDHPDVWAELLDDDVLAALTPYGAGRRPGPDEADVARICECTSNAHVAGPLRVKLPRASSPVEKVRRRAVRSATVSERPLGHVRCRRELADDAWSVTLDGEARRLCQVDDPGR